MSFVCTGNRNRSAFAEAYIRRAAESRPIEVDSVGLLDLDAAPALPEAISAARLMGLDLTPHISRALAAVDISARDLVLGLEWQHVAAAVVDGGVPRAKAFTLAELVSLLEHLDWAVDGFEEDARAVVEAADLARDQGHVTSEFDIPDPFGGPSTGFKEMMHTVAGYCDRLLNGLFGPTPD